MKIRTIMTALMLVIVTAVFAQPGPKRGGSPEERAKMMTDKMTEKLGLSEDQRKELLALNLDKAKRMEAARAAGREDREARRQEMQAERKSYDAKIQDILTAEQYEKFKAAREAQMQKMGKKREHMMRDSKKTTSDDE